MIREFMTPSIVKAEKDSTNKIHTSNYKRELRVGRRPDSYNICSSYSRAAHDPDFLSLPMVAWGWVVRWYLWWWHSMSWRGQVATQHVSGCQCRWWNMCGDISDLFSQWPIGRENGQSLRLWSDLQSDAPNLYSQFWARWRGTTQSPCDEVPLRKPLLSSPLYKPKCVVCNWIGMSWWKIQSVFHSVWHPTTPDEIMPMTIRKRQLRAGTEVHLHWETPHQVCQKCTIIMQSPCTLYHDRDDECCSKAAASSRNEEGRKNTMKGLISKDKPERVRLPPYPHTQPLFQIRTASLSPSWWTWDLHSNFLWTLWVVRAKCHPEHGRRVWERNPIWLLPVSIFFTIFNKN